MSIQNSSMADDAESPRQENQIGDAPASHTTSKTSKIIIIVLLVLALILSAGVAILGLRLTHLTNKKDDTDARKTNGVKTMTMESIPPDDSKQQPEKIPILQETVEDVAVETTSEASSSSSSLPSSSSSPSIDGKASTVSPVSSVSKVCLTPECVSAAARIIYNLDQSVDPCRNFYNFACGGGVQKTTLSDDNPDVTIMQEIVDKVQANIQEIAEEAPRTNDIGPVLNMKNLYRSCVDVGAIDDRDGETLLLDWLTEKISPWPILTPSMTSSDLDLTDIAVKVSKYGYSFSIVSMFLRPDSKDSNKNVLMMDQAQLLLPPSYFLKGRDNEQLMAYETFIKRVTLALGLDPDIANAEVAAIVDFEILIANISVADMQSSNVRTTLGEFDRNYSSNNFDIKKYILGVMGSDDVGVTDIADDEIVINTSPQFFQNFKTILDSVPKKTVANFMIWKAVKSLLDHLPKKFRDIKKQYIEDFSKLTTVGLIPKSDRKKDCTKFVDKTMTFAIARSFVDHYVEPDTKDVVTEMISGLQTAFIELLEDVNWMDEPTKRLAREKNEAMGARIVYPDFLKNSTKLEEMYKHFTFEPAKLFENKLKIMQIAASVSYGKLRRPVNKGKWLDSPQTVNAFYRPSYNLISITAGILQPPVFSTKYPKYLAYASVGSIIGHEITHGFDNQGRLYDKDGNVKQWWKTSIIKKFKKQKKCMIDQYSSYKMDEANVTVDGTLTQGENIADNGGLKQSYKAYTNWVKIHGTESTLPGLNYTVDQLYFIRYGQLWCTKAIPEVTRLKILYDTHSPGKYRANGPLRNFDEFAKSFNCPQSTYMNPDEKCNVW